MDHRMLLAPAALVAALALPAAASAATLQVPGSCAFGGGVAPVAGAGFSPNAQVTLASNAGTTTSALTDATGSFQATVAVPSVSDYSTHTFSLTATDSVNPAVTAATSFGVVKEPFATNFPINGRPGSVVRWRFAGFQPGQPIYGHYRYKGRTIRNYRFGTATGPCGTLSVMARRLPAKSRPGKWTVQFDQRKTYNRFTKPRRVASFTIFRTFS